MAGRPAVGSLAERLYREMLPLAHVDAEHGWALLKLCAALCEPKQWVQDIVRDTDAGPGLSALIDPDRCPAPFLPWCAQFHGAVFPPGLDDAARRAHIKDAPGTRRGRPGSIVAAAQLFLTGTRRVVYRNQVDGSMYRQEIVTFLAETPDPGAVWRALLTQKPGGHTFIHTVLTGWSIDATEVEYDLQTIAELEGDFATIAELEMNLPPPEALVGGVEAEYSTQTIAGLEGAVPTINDLGGTG